MNLALLFRLPILAAGDLVTNLSAVASVLNAIAILLFFGGLLMAAIMCMIYLKYGLVGAGLGGLSFVIVNTFFTAGTGVDPGIELGAP